MRTLLLLLLSVNVFSQHLTIGVSSNENALFAQTENQLCRQLSYGGVINAHHGNFKGVSIEGFQRIFLNDEANIQLSLRYGYFGSFRIIGQSLGVGLKTLNFDTYILDLSFRVNFNSSPNTLNDRILWYKTTSFPLELRVSFGLL